MVMGETWPKNMEMKMMMNSNKILLRSMILMNQKLVKVKQKKLS